jgi:hypothetical protein
MMRVGPRAIRHHAYMSAEGSENGGPLQNENIFWYWLTILIFLFMGVVVVMALIQTHAQ